MTIQQLEYAVALGKYGSFKLAADQLGISQPALSMQIMKLEKEIDIVIFDRSRKKVEITQKGEIFLSRAKVLIHEMRQLRLLVDQLNEDPIGEVRIGIIPTLAPYLLPLFIDQLNREFNQLRVHIKEALTEEIIQDLAHGELDGGIIATPIQSHIHLESMTLFYEGLKLFVSPQHPLYERERIPVQDLPLCDLWLLKEGNCFRDQVENICETVRHEHEEGMFQFESSSIESLCRIVEFKGGITFLPELTTMHLAAEREDMIKELDGIRRVREISLVYMPRHLMLNDLHHLGDVIRKNLPRNLLERGNAETIPTNVVV